MLEGISHFINYFLWKVGQTFSFPPTTSTDGQENSKLVRERNVDQSVQNERGEDYEMVRQTMRLVLSVQHEVW